MPPRTKQSKRTFAQRPAEKAKPTPAPEPAPAPVAKPAPKAAPKPKGPSAGSLARHKSALLAELRTAEVTPERTLEIRVELDGPLAGVPILSYAELQRLGD